MLAHELAVAFELDDDAFAKALIVIVDDGSAALFVAEVDGRVVGYVLGNPRHLLCQRTGRLDGRDLGRPPVPAPWCWSLARCSVRGARHRGATLVALATRRATDFYDALGYASSGTYWRKIL